MRAALPLSRRRCSIELLGGRRASHTQLDLVESDVLAGAEVSHCVDLMSLFSPRDLQHGVHALDERGAAASFATPMSPSALFARSAFFSRLTSAFGWRYILAVVLTYGCNQSFGEQIFLQARQYWLLDDIGLSSAAFGPVIAYSRLPAQVCRYPSLTQVFPPPTMAPPSASRVCPFR